MNVVMKITFSLLAVIAGLAAIIFHRHLSNTMMPYYSVERRTKAIIVMRIASVVIGAWMLVIGLWLLYRHSSI